MSWVGKLNIILLFFFPPPSLGFSGVHWLPFVAPIGELGPWVVGPAQHPMAEGALGHILGGRVPIT